MSGSSMPWWAKVAAKVVMARLPVSYERWRQLGVFRHGEMLDPDYAIRVFDRHYDRVKATLPPDFAVLELGPGDSLATAVIAAARGASQVYLVDAGAFASMEGVAGYNALAERLASLGMPVKGAPFASVQAMLAATNATYLTEGLSSLSGLPDRSFDLVFSQAVLEHVALGEFDVTMREMYRVQKPGTATSHRVDLQDHLAHSLNSLRFSRAVWESKLMSSSGFYTNRLRASQVLDAIRRAGYQVELYAPDEWPTLPLPKRKMHPDFARLAEDDLRVRGLDVVARRPRS
jgi:SAM-dependent methyltransferase